MLQGGARPPFSCPIDDVYAVCAPLVDKTMDLLDRVLHNPADGGRDVTWSEVAGIYVIANIRGGGEYGPTWHTQAQKAGRHLVYEDFAAVAQDLIARKIKTGAVWINGFGLIDPRLPWGGRKTSGLGSELSYSGIEENTVEKTVTMVL